MEKELITKEEAKFCKEKGLQLIEIIKMKKEKIFINETSYKYQELLRKIMAKSNKKNIELINSIKLCAENGMIKTYTKGYSSANKIPKGIYNLVLKTGGDEIIKALSSIGNEQILDYIPDRFPKENERYVKIIKKYKDEPYITEVIKFINYERILKAENEEQLIKEIEFLKEKTRTY